MKFTRTLALAALAASAVSFTSCDSTDSADPVVEAVTFNLGNQNSAATSASAFSARDLKQVSLTELGSDSAKWSRIDVVILTEFSAVASTGDSLTFYSPYEVSTKTAVFPGTAAKITTAKATRTTTQFATVDITQDEFTALKNSSDVKKITDAIPSAAWSSSVGVVNGDRVALKLIDGSFAIVNIVSASGAYSVSGTTFGYNVQVRLAK